MDTRDLHEKGLKLRRQIFGEEAVQQRAKAFGAFGEPLQNMINAYAYGGPRCRSRSNRWSRLP
jgi:4-carboxymuconolactone decarboxylase